MTKSYFVRTCYRTPEGQLVSPHPKAKGFIWPERVGSVVVAPDWDPTETCGGGLHGLRPGDQEPGEWAEGPNAVWMICSYDPTAAVVLLLGAIIKVPTCVVEYVVDWAKGASTLVPLWLKERGVIEPIYRGDSIVGDKGVAIVGNEGTAKAGRAGKAIAGDYGIATAGDYGTAISGYCGRSIVGDYGLAIVGLHGKAQAGQGGIIQIYRYHKCIVTGYIGEDGLEANTTYGLDADGKFISAQEITNIEAFSRFG